MPNSTLLRNTRYNRAKATPSNLPFTQSNIALAVYVFSIIYLSNKPEGRLSTFIGFVFAFVFVSEFVITRRRYIFLPREYISLFAFLWLLLTSSLWAVRQDLALTRTFTVFQLLVFSIITVNVLVANKNIRPLAIGLIAGVAWAILEALYSNNFVFTETIVYRPASTLDNANLYALALLIGIWISVYMYRQIHRQALKVLTWVFIGLAIHQIIFFTGSVKGILALSVGVPLALIIRNSLLSNFRFSRIVALVLVMPTAFFVGQWLLSQTPYYWRIEELEQRITVGEDPRARMIDFGLEKWQQKPFFGYGTDQFRVHYQTVSPRGLLSYSHNNYVELLFNNGVVGLILYYLFFASVAHKYWRLYKRKLLSDTQLTWAYVGLIEFIFLSTAMVAYYEKLIWVFISILLTVPYTIELSVEADKQLG